MKEKFIGFCSLFYWEVRFAIEKRNLYNNYYRKVLKAVSKIKNIKEDLLTDEQKLEIDKFYKKYYGKKIPYIWHSFFMSYTNKFDVRYLPPKVFIEIIGKLNVNEPRYDLLLDKNFFYNSFEKLETQIPKRLFYSIKGLFFDSEDNIISKEELFRRLSNTGYDVFIKPTGLFTSCRSKNCRIINVSAGIDVYSKMNIKEMIEQYYKNDFVIQEKIVCHKSISDIYPKSVNSFSIYSFIWNNEVKILNKPIFKIGMNGHITDYSGLDKEGLMLVINDDGVLSDSAFCVRQDKWYTSHPDTGFVFKNHKIENFHKVPETIKKMHALIPWLRFCRWDVTIDVDGNPVLIEVERPAELFPQQVLYKEGFFGEYTEELLSLLRTKNNVK